MLKNLFKSITKEVAKEVKKDITKEVKTATTTMKKEVKNNIKDNIKENASNNKDTGTTSLGAAYEKTTAPSADVLKAKEELAKLKQESEDIQNALQKEIDDYKEANPNNDCTFKILHKPKSNDENEWSGYYIKVTEINPTNNEISIPNICDIFNPVYSSNESLIVKADKNCKLKNSHQLFGKVNVETLDVSQLELTNLGNLAGMFHGCKSKVINVSNWDLSTAPNNSIAGLFRYLETNEIVGLETWDTSSIKRFYQVFYETKCAKLNITNWSLKSVSNGKDMSNNFFQSSKLGPIDLTNWDISNVTSLEGWFLKASIESIGNISNWNVSNVTNCKYMFKSAKFVEGIDLTSWKIKNNCDLTDMFSQAGSNIIK